MGAEDEGRSSKRWLHILAAVVFIGGAVAVIVNVVREHQHGREVRETIARLQAGLNAMVPKSGLADVHATVNGVASHITFTSAPQGIADAATAVADTCGKDAETGGAEAVPTGDTPRPRFVRQSVHRDESADGSVVAVLCVFRSTETGERFERFSFVRGDARSSSVTSVTRQSKADITEAFPKEGDAPGDDLPGVPRPEGSRRTISANIVETGHAVRIYELPRKAEPSEEIRLRREAVDQQMRAAGFQPSAAVAKVLDDTRLYVRGSDRIVVSVEPFGEVTRIVINRADLL